MRVTLLVDNLAIGDLRPEHGLSILVETSGASVLFDAGQSDAWFHNLSDLGGDAASIDAAAISHGHYDHTGGLPKLFEVTSEARCFAHPSCFEPRYARTADGLRYIGMPEQALSRKNAFSLNTAPVEIMPGVWLSGEIATAPTGWPMDERFAAGAGGVRQDTFKDEQCLIVRERGAAVVLVGCAHRGLDNNLRAALSTAGVRHLDLLVGGFHLGGASREYLDHLADYLDSVEINEIACCHCTGAAAYEHLRSRLGDRVTQARAGTSWSF